jgi:hypothetical protein
MRHLFLRDTTLDDDSPNHVGDPADLGKTVAHGPRPSTITKHTSEGRIGKSRP